MPRVCLIGDSHLAALKFAVPAALGDRTDIRLIFFAGPGETMEALAVSGDALVATDETLRKPMQNISGGMREIRDEYDCYFLHGLGLTIGKALVIARDRRSADALLPRIDDAAFRAELAFALRNTLAVRILAMLRQITSAPVFFSPRPISHLQFAGPRRLLGRSGQGENLVRLFEAVCVEIGESLHARFLPQPALTRDDHGLAAKPIYSHEPSRLSSGQVAQDKSHMNAEYGAAVLRDFLAAASLSSG